MQLSPWPEKAKAPTMSPWESTLRVHLGRNTLTKAGMPWAEYLKIHGTEKEEGEEQGLVVPCFRQ